MSPRSDQIAALKQFRAAFENLQRNWCSGSFNLNDTYAIEQYPFHNSLDELPVRTWVNRTIRELEFNGDHVPATITSGDIRTMMKIIREKRDDIGCVSAAAIDGLYDRLKWLEYNASVIDFYKMLDRALPDLPNSTPSEQEAYDEAWEKFYSTDFVISFGDKSVRICNDATAYNGILDTLKEIVENCL